MTIHIRVRPNYGYGAYGLGGMGMGMGMGLGGLGVGAMGMSSDLPSPAICFSHRGLDFRIGVLLRAGLNPFRQNRARGHDLDEIGTLLELLAYHADQFGGIVGAAGIRENLLLRVVVIGVLVSAKNIDRVPADAQSRSRK